MKELIRLQNTRQNIVAEVDPDHGGMITQLWVNDREILYFNKNSSIDSPISEGGIPILFPFAGQVKDDRYEIDGTTYKIEKHGFVKEQKFQVVKRFSDQIVLEYQPDPSYLQKSYPYPFRLQVVYHVNQNGLDVLALVQNQSSRPMPHSLGWHPYFKATDRTTVQLEYRMKTHYDYVNQRDLPAPATIDLSCPLDDVYCNPEKNFFFLRNPGDGYELICKMQQAYQSIVVYTGTEGSVCIEPWCGIPDSLHHHRFLQWILPGETKEYRLEYVVSTLHSD